MKTIIKTSRLTIFPLSPEQLSDFLDAPEKLEILLEVRISRKIIDANVRRAIHLKISHLSELAREEQVWRTYWLIKINQTAFGAGLIGFKGKPDKSGSVEIGYGIDPEVQNQGYMTEALQAMISWAFEQPECNSVTANTTVNPASNHILAKSGFELLLVSDAGSNWIKYKKPLELLLPSFQFKSIGLISTPFEDAAGTPIQPTASEDTAGVITLDPHYTAALKDLDGFSHIILIYVFDRSSAAKLLVKPFMDDSERGVFATRAPSRPNPIGISVVRLVRIEHNQLFISGVDMLNNTPLLDIKPYVPHFNPGVVERIGWLVSNINRLEATKDDGRFTQKD
jgi:tRNA-Thr(GGU) m(6)t(6)A37 methyltransferase TsaA